MDIQNGIKANSALSTSKVMLQRKLGTVTGGCAMWGVVSSCLSSYSAGLHPPDVVCKCLSSTAHCWACSGSSQAREDAWPQVFVIILPRWWQRTAWYSGGGVDCFRGYKCPEPTVPYSLAQTPPSVLNCFGEEVVSRSVSSFQFQILSCFASCTKLENVKLRPWNCIWIEQGEFVWFLVW